MKRLLIAATAVLALTAAAAWAQQGPGRGAGWGGRGMMYDPSKVETISGKVTEVKEFPSRNGVNKGIHAVVESGGKNITVVLGPDFYLEQQKVKIAAGDTIEVTGMKTFRRGQDVFMAGTVKKDGQELKLRDENGRPLWAGAGRGAGRQPGRAGACCQS